MNANYKISTEYDGQKRRLFPKTCVCGTEHWLPKHLLDKTTYCSRECSDKHHSVKVEVSCTQCGKILKRTPSQMAGSKHGLYFCNRECKELAQSLTGNCDEIRPSHYGNGYTEYRNHVVIDKCVGCGDDRICILIVHHVDGNRKNGSRENLEVVCPSCHALRHMKLIDGTWRHYPQVLTPRELIMGFGTARSGRLIRNEEDSRVQIPGGPPRK